MRKSSKKPDVLSEIAANEAEIARLQERNKVLQAEVYLDVGQRLVQTAGQMGLTPEQLLAKIAA